MSERKRDRKISKQDQISLIMIVVGCFLIGAAFVSLVGAFKATLIAIGIAFIALSLYQLEDTEIRRRNR